MSFYGEIAEPKTNQVRKQISYKVTIDRQLLKIKIGRQTASQAQGPSCKASANKLTSFPSLQRWLLICSSSHAILHSLSIIHSLLLLIAHHLPLKCVPLKDRDFIQFTASSVPTTVKCINVLNEQINTSDPPHSNFPLPSTFPLTLCGNRGC